MDDLCLGAACTGCILVRAIVRNAVELCLGAACTGCIESDGIGIDGRLALPRRCLHGVHLYSPSPAFQRSPLPRRCLHGVHPVRAALYAKAFFFASALPARGASLDHSGIVGAPVLCLGAACTGCIGKSRQIAAHHFVAYAVSR